MVKVYATSYAPKPNRASERERGTSNSTGESERGQYIVGETPYAALRVGCGLARRPVTGGHETSTFPSLSSPASMRDPAATLPASTAPEQNHRLLLRWARPKHPSSVHDPLDHASASTWASPERAACQSLRGEPGTGMRGRPYADFPRRAASDERPRFRP